MAASIIVHDILLDVRVMAFILDTQAHWAAWALSEDALRLIMSEFRPQSGHCKLRNSSIRNRFDLDDFTNWFDARSRRNLYREGDENEDENGSLTARARSAAAARGDRSEDGYAESDGRPRRGLPNRRRTSSHLLQLPPALRDIFAGLSLPDPPPKKDETFAWLDHEEDAVLVNIAGRHFRKHQLRWMFAHWRRRANPKFIKKLMTDIAKEVACK
eukprot:6776579-Pyramimonas_sp.AAC.1